MHPGNKPEANETSKQNSASTYPSMKKVPEHTTEDRAWRGSLSSSISSLGNQPQDMEPLPTDATSHGTQDTTVDGLAINNDDAIAMMMSELMACESNNDTVHEPSLASRAAIIESIRWLGRHIPRCALSQISQHVVNLGNKLVDNTPMALPHVSTYRAALLFIDMSGFTKLSQHLDVESLSKVRMLMIKQHAGMKRSSISVDERTYYCTNVYFF